MVLTLRPLRNFMQLLKFGLSGVLGVAISTFLFYGFRERLPMVIWLVGFWVWIYPLNVPDMTLYLLTTVIGGSVHFLLSKVWVFKKQ